MRMHKDDACHVGGGAAYFLEAMLDPFLEAKRALKEIVNVAGTSSEGTDTSLSKDKD